MSSKLQEGIDFYFENGNLVFTEAYHLKRGYCCGNGCRHCPYQYENVPEPLKSELIKQQLILKNEKKSK
jgi:hypothetical protein